MAGLKIYDYHLIGRKFSTRPGETKLGEEIGLVGNIDELKNSKARFVLLGIPEDIGVRANYGRPGASTAWEAFLQSFLGIQKNKFLVPQNVLLLGEIDCREELSKAGNLDASDPNYHLKLGELVEKIDKSVSETIQSICASGKIPIIIGGGHNNAYPILNGASKAINKPLNALNIDAHSDLRKMGYRHSGNGFSFAIKEKLLKKYAIFGLHENYTPQYIFDQVDGDEDIRYVLFDGLSRGQMKQAFDELLEFTSNEAFGLEADCDSIAGFPSSAVSPTGFSLEEVRDFVRKAAGNKNCVYFHLCEAADSDLYPTGKALAYLVSDFIKNRFDE